LEPRLEEAKAGKRTVFFVDAAHFVLRAYLGFLWCFARVMVRAPSGRQRFNVLGALDAATHQLITVTNDSYINSISVCSLLEKIAQLGLKGPITLVMDNARYQRCQLVMQTAKRLGIELLFLPSYSPNLNLIERFWKFVKKECLYSKYYENFDLFKQAITECLSQTTGRHKTRLHRLLTLAFQTFKPATSDLR
jgi:transposase